MTEGSYRVVAAEDDDGLDGIDKRSYNIEKAFLQPWMILEYSGHGRQQLLCNRG